MDDVSPLIFSAKLGVLAPDRFHKWRNAKHLQHPFEIVGQDMQAHLCAEIGIHGLE